MPFQRIALLLVNLSICCGPIASAAELPRIRVADDQRSFIQETSEKPWYVL
jgi:hypothetical protein